MQICGFLDSCLCVHVFCAPLLNCTGLVVWCQQAGSMDDILSLWTGCFAAAIPASKSQNRRIFWVGRGSQGSLKSNPWPCTGSPENHPRVTMCLRALFNHFLSSVRPGSVTAPLGTLFQWQTTCWVTNLFFTTGLNLLWHSFIPFPCVLSLSPETRNQYLHIHLPSRGRCFKMEIILSENLYKDQIKSNPTFFVATWKIWRLFAVCRSSDDHEKLSCFQLCARRQETYLRRKNQHCKVMGKCSVWMVSGTFFTLWL